MQKKVEAVKKGMDSVTKSLTPAAPVRRFIMIVVLTVVGLAVVGVGVSIVGIYTAHWEAPIIKDVARVIPVPALTVNGHWRSYHEYLDAVATLDYSMNQTAVLQASGYSQKPSTQELRTMVVDRMVKEEVIIQLAKKRGVTVSKADIDAEMKKLSDQTGSEAEVASQVKQLYKWDLATFREKVIRPYLLRQRLQESIGNDTAINADSLKRAQAALARVKAGEDFTTIAKDVNENSTKSTGGDMGIYAKGTQDAAIEAAAFSLKVGETSDIIKTTDGYYIIKVLEKIAADTATSQPEKVHTAEIFIATKQLDTWLYEQSKTQKIRIFLSGYTWNVQNATVVYAKKGTVTNTNSAVNLNTNTP